MLQLWQNNRKEYPDKVEDAVACNTLCRDMRATRETMPRHVGRDSNGRIEYVEAYKHVYRDMSPEAEKKNKKFDLY